jgi:hypothetical protein
MLVVSKNDILLENLDSEDLALLEKTEDSAVIEILKGDESAQYSLGEVWELKDLASFEPGDRLLSSYVDESEIPFKFEKRKGYYAGEFIYECAE